MRAAAAEETQGLDASQRVDEVIGKAHELRVAPRRALLRGFAQHDHIQDRDGVAGEGDDAGGPVGGEDGDEDDDGYGHNADHLGQYEL